MSARKSNREGARKRPASHRMSPQARKAEIDRLYAGALLSVRLVQTIGAMLLGAIDDEKKAANAALIAWAAFGRLTTETQHVLLCASNLDNDERGGNQ